MPLVRVWNDNTVDHVEDFKGKKLRIESNRYIEMDAEEAIEFKGNYFPPKVDAAGMALPEGKKRIRIEHLTNENYEKPRPEHISHLTGKDLGSKEAVEAEARANEDKLEPEAREEVLKRGKGRPPKKADDSDMRF